MVYRHSKFQMSLAVKLTNYLSECQLQLDYAKTQFLASNYFLYNTLDLHSFHLAYSMVTLYMGTSYAVFIF